LIQDTGKGQKTLALEVAKKERDPADRETGSGTFGRQGPAAVMTRDCSPLLGPRGKARGF